MTDSTFLRQLQKESRTKSSEGSPRVTSAPCEALRSGSAEGGRSHQSWRRCCALRPRPRSHAGTGSARRGHRCPRTPRSAAGAGWGAAFPQRRGLSAAQRPRGAPTSRATETAAARGSRSPTQPRTAPPGPGAAPAPRPSPLPRGFPRAADSRAPAPLGPAPGTCRPGTCTRRASWGTRRCWAAPRRRRPLAPPRTGRSGRSARWPCRSRSPSWEGARCEATTPWSGPSGWSGGPGAAPAAARTAALLPAKRRRRRCPTSPHRAPCGGTAAPPRPGAAPAAWTRRRPWPRYRRRRQPPAEPAARSAPPPPRSAPDRPSPPRPAGRSRSYSPALAARPSSFPPGPRSRLSAAALRAAADSAVPLQRGAFPPSAPDRTFPQGKVVPPPPCAALLPFTTRGHGHLVSSHTPTAALGRHCRPVLSPCTTTGRKHRGQGKRGHHIPGATMLLCSPSPQFNTQCGTSRAQDEVTRCEVACGEASSRSAEPLLAVRLRPCWPEPGINCSSAKFNSSPAQRTRKASLLWRAPAVRSL